MDYLYDTDYNVIDNPDTEIGMIDIVMTNLEHDYIVTVPEVVHEEVLREYPETGGKEVIYVVDVEEKGYWEHRVSETGKVLEKFDEEYLIINGASHFETVKDEIPLMVYRLFTPEELEENARKRAEFEAEQAKQEEQQQMLDDMPELLCTLYEASLSQQETIDAQNEVLCALYETMLEGGE